MLTAFLIWFTTWLSVVVIGALYSLVRKKEGKSHPDAHIFGLFENILYVVLLVAVLYVAGVYFFAAI